MIANAKSHEHFERQERERVARERQTAMADLIRAVGARYGPDRVSLDNYQTTQHKGQEVILAKVKALAARLPEAVKNGEAVIWYGTPGCGKDHLLMGLLYLAIHDHGLSVEWQNGQDLLQTLSNVAKGKLATMHLKNLYRADILAISDPLPPAAEPADWQWNLMHQIVDRRYREQKATWMTVNVMTTDEMADRFGQQTFDRLRHGGHLLPCIWPSYRGNE